MISDSFFLKKISTSFSLLFISFLAFIIGYWVIAQAQELKKLQKPLPFYISHLATSTLSENY